MFNPKILNILEKKQKKQFFRMLFISITISLLDTIGVSSILPLMSILSNPNILESNSILLFLFDYLKFENKNSFIIVLSISISSFIILIVILKTISSILQVNYLKEIESYLSFKLYKTYLHNSYEWYLNKNSSNLVKSLYSDTQNIVGGILEPVFTLISNIFIVSFIIILLIFINNSLLYYVICLILIIYLFIYFILKNYIKEIGLKSTNLHEMRYKLANETFGSIKILKLFNLEAFYVSKLKDINLEFFKYNKIAVILSQMPRYLLEGLGIAIILIYLLKTYKQDGGIISVIPQLALYIFAGYRLVPAFQQIYRSIITIKFNSPILNSIYNELTINKFDTIKNKKIKLNFEKHLELKNIYYGYPNTNRNVIENVSLKINSKSIVGLIGVTGSGKSTLLNIMTGLLLQKSGKILIDGVELNSDNFLSWQTHIGYVPQDIYLSDRSISENIAYADKESDIDYEKLTNVSKLANIHDFIINELPDSYSTIVGENGIRLSGGQKQRIGIARALYKNPSFLVFDEATSSLDSSAEKLIIESISNLKGKVTIIIVTHRISSVKICDEIFLFEQGKVADHGSFEELNEKNIKFKILNK